MQLLAGVPVLDLGLVNISFGMVQVVLEQGFGLLLIGVDESFGDLFFQEFEILLVQGILEKFQIQLTHIVGEVLILDHADQRFAYVDRVDAPAGLGEGVIKGLHDEAGRDAAHALTLDLLAQFLHVDLLCPPLLHHLFPIVEPQLGHQVTLGGWLEARQHREHRDHLQGVRGDVGAKVGVA